MQLSCNRCDDGRAYEAFALRSHSGLGYGLEYDLVTLESAFSAHHELGAPLDWLHAFLTSINQFYPQAKTASQDF